jgi:hypothetical protein
MVALTLAALAEPQAIGPARPVQLAKGDAETAIWARQKTARTASNGAATPLPSGDDRPWDFGDKKRRQSAAPWTTCPHRRARHLAPSPACDGRATGFMSKASTRRHASRST